ncbi:pentatricopeptide repeat-containing protein At2g27800, mitochondrial-like [Phalaenopsis equestris]|uniref:pentatricopeptide repeat-containing protein At2g27800, mitochondrial-like n=1 Tax=Phalaenopsis equestris TaxID=78828 RepID=UPI0009E55607|nr:pentatricopeptide repeat-containing protein At2g27800, mitochondrial-like [Phalaenopsis equestris]
MIRALRSLRSPFFSSSPLPFSLLKFRCRNLISPHSSDPTNPTIPFSTTRISTHGLRRRKKNFRDPPPDQSQISAAVASLPPRFTSSDLSAAIARLHDLRLCIPLLHCSLHRPNLVRHGDSTAFSPFLIAVKRLGTAHLYREMDSAASLAFSISSLPEAFFNALIHFYSEARWVSKAIGVYKIMRSSRSAAQPTTRTFHLLFNAILGHRGANSYIHHLYMDALRSLFRQMVGSGVAPDIYALNAMIKGYVLSLHLNDALRIFHQMVPIYGVVPDEHTYSYLVHGLCSQGRTRNAKELYVEMREKRLVPTTRACNSLVSVLSMAGEVEEAEAVMWEGVGMGRCPDFITCRTVVEEICRQGRAGDAVVLLREMRQKEVIDGRFYKELLAGLGEEYRDYWDQN